MQAYTIRITRASRNGRSRTRRKENTMNQRRFPRPAVRGAHRDLDRNRPQGKDPSERPQGKDPSERPQGKDPSERPQGKDPSGRPQGKDPSGRPQGGTKTPPARPDDPGAGEATLQPGLKPVLELLERDPGTIDTVFVRKGRKGADTDRILDLARAAGVRFSLVDDAFLERLYSGRHQGAIARLFAAGFHDPADLLEKACDAPLPLLLALDQVQDPGNAGTLARTLYAMGGAGLLVPRHNGVYLGAAAARVSAGALGKLPVAKVANLGQALDEAEKAGFTLYGAWSGPGPDPSRIADAFTFIPRLPAVLVLGGEDAGLRPHIAKRCASLVRIPLAREFDSLNVAQAGAIIIGAFAARGDRAAR